MNLYNLFSILIIIPFASIVFFTVKKKPELGIYLITFSLPFERIPSWEVPILGGITVRVSHILVLVTLITLAINLFLNKLKISFDKLDSLLLLCFFVMGLSLFFAQNVSRGIYVWVFLWFCFLIFWLFRNLITKENMPIIEKIVFYSTLLICGFALYQFFGDMFGLSNIFTGLKDSYTKEVMGFPRVQSFSYEPLFFANYLLFPLGLFSFLFISKQNKISNKNVLFLLSLISCVLTLTVSSGGIIASVFIIACLFIFGIFILKAIKKTFSVMLAIIIGVLIAILAINISSGLVDKKEAVQSFSVQATNFSQGSSVSERVEWRNAALKGFKENPMFGIGLGNFGPWFAGYPNQAPKDGWLVVNNETLEILVETGLVGFIPFVVFSLLLLKKAILKYLKADNDYEKALCAALIVIVVAFAIQYQSFSTLYIVYIWAVIGILAALVTDKKITYLKRIA